MKIDTYKNELKPQYASCICIMYIYFENSTPPQLLSTSDAFGSVVANDVITPIRQRSVSSSTLFPIIIKYLFHECGHIICL